MLVRIVVCSKVRGEQLVPMVRIIVRVFLQKYIDCLGKKCVDDEEDHEEMDDWGFWVLLALLDFIGMLSVGTGVGVVDKQFWKLNFL